MATIENYNGQTLFLRFWAYSSQQEEDILITSINLQK